MIDKVEARRNAEYCVNLAVATAVPAVLGAALIPGAATTLLCGIEAALCYKISLLYGRELSPGEAKAAAAAIGLAAVAGKIAALEAAILLGPFAFAVKPMIAAAIVKTLGKLIILHFEDNGRGASAVSM